MLSLAHVCEFPTFSNYKIRITLLIFPKCRGEVIAFLTANLAKIFEREGVIAIENLYCDRPSLEHETASHAVL